MPQIPKLLYPVNPKILVYILFDPLLEKSVPRYRLCKFLNTLNEQSSEFFSRELISMKVKQCESK